MVAFAAAAYGGVEPWGELILVLTSGVAIAVAFAEAVRNGLRRSVATMLVIASFLGIMAWGQSLQLPGGWVELLSPTRHATVTDLLGQSPDWLSLSYNPADTHQSLRLLLVGVAVFAVVATGVRDTRNACRLLLGLFAIGLGESLLALAQQATHASGIYWGTVEAGGLRSGSFVNHSNFCQLLNLTIGASLGLFLIRLSEDRRSQDPRVHRDRGLRGVFRRHGWLVIGIAIQAIAIAASLSRAGVIAMLLGSTAALALLGRKHSIGRAIWLLAAVPPIAFLALIWLGFDAFFDRIETLHGEAPLSDRIELAIATLRVGVDHWLTGAGLGAHASVFPAYDTTGAVAFAEQADNDYAQLFEEMGLPGCLLVAALAGVSCHAVKQLLSRHGEPIRYAAIGIVYGMVAIGIQSLTDFGLRLPAVLGAAAALAGIAFGVAKSLSPLNQRMAPNRMATAALAATLLAGCWTAALISSVSEYRAERWWSLAYDLDQRVRFAGPQADPQNYLDLVAAAETAAGLKPDRPKYAFWLNTYRWQAVEFASLSMDPALIPDRGETALAIADRLASTRQLCATFGPAYTLEGQLRLMAGDESGADLIRKGVRLSPNDPVACFAAATERLRAEPDAGSDKIAFDLLTRAVKLDGQFYLEAAQAVVNERDDVATAVAIAKGNPSRLRSLAKWLGTLDDGIRLEAEKVLQLADEAQRERIKQGRVSVNDVAAYAARMAALGQHEEATIYWRAALADQFQNVPWRLSLVDSLIKTGRLEEARREVGVCLRQQPRSSQAKKRLVAIKALQDEQNQSDQAGR